MRVYVYLRARCMLSCFDKTEMHPTGGELGKDIWETLEEANHDHGN